MSQQDKINIRPQVTMLSVLKYLEYESWFALAEFIDNSLVSFLKNEKDLKDLEGRNFILQVKIEFNEQEKKITIRDNAAGIAETDFARAFRAAEIPPDNTGLSEFGMGMKSAACWFADRWKVTTKALDENIEKTVFFDMQEIFEDKIEEIEVNTISRDKTYHYTTIELFDVNRMPQKRNINKIKEHLKSIYREFIRKKKLILKIDNEELNFEEVKILNAQKYNEPDGKSIFWKKEIDFQLDEKMSVKGFVALREKASTSEAGFSLFRRGRVVQGSYNEGFRPDFIFGASNSYRYQRIFGELHLEGFDVNFTKKGIHWDENLEVFLRLLKDDISHDDFPLFQQAEQYRVRASEKEYKAAKKALDETVDDFAKKAPKAVADIINSPAISTPEQKTLSNTDKTLHREFDICFNQENWKISIELSYDTSLKELIEIGNAFINPLKGNSLRTIGIRLSLTHPFMIEFAGADANKIEPILRIAAALGLSEVIAKSSGIKTQGEVRRNFNELISNLSKQ
jgi:hypothetical protein